MRVCVTRTVKRSLKQKGNHVAKKNESQPIPEMDIDTAKEIENKALSKLKRHGLVKRTESDDNSPDKFRAAVLFVAMILFILLVFVEGSAGWNLIHRIIRGFFGVTSLLVPVLIGMAAWRADSDYENDVIQATPKWNIIITIIIAGAVQILFNGSAGDAGFISYIKYLRQQNPKDYHAYRKILIGYCLF